MTPREKWARRLADRSLEELRAAREVYAGQVEGHHPGLSSAVLHENALTALREIDCKLRKLK